VRRSKYFRESPGDRLAHSLKSFGQGVASASKNIVAVKKEILDKDSSNF